MKKSIQIIFLHIVALTLISLPSCGSEDPIKPDLPKVIVNTPWTHDTPYPFDMPPLNTLRANTKKVFAHYFTPYPLQFDNSAPESDYYAANYMSAKARDASEQKWNVVGGLLRIRPLPQLDYSNSNYVMLNFEEEVKRANAIGIDGFTVDILGNKPGNSHFDRIVALCNAAQKVDPSFKILLMPDMEYFKELTQIDLENCINELSKYTSVYRFDDNRLVLSPYNAQVWSVQQWKSFLTNMKSKGLDIVFYPLFQNWKKYAVDFAPISYGMSDWGEGSVSAQSRWRDVADQAHSYGVKWMMPVRPQDFRPKDSFYSEAKNSEQYRTTWANAINHNSDWVQIITWNDYSETSSISPSTGTFYSFYDLSAYYSLWFKTGIQPTIQRDVLYYFYRSQLTNAKTTEQSSSFTLQHGSDEPNDEIELLAFLKEPGTLEIEIGDKTKQYEGQTGVNSFKIPAEAGRPTFRLKRNDKTIIVLGGKYEIKNSVKFQNFTYYGGSNSRKYSYSNMLDYQN